MVYTRFPSDNLILNSILDDHNTILNIVKYILYEYGKYTFIPSLGYERYQDGYCKLPEGTTTTSTTEVSTTHKYTTKATTETSPEYSEQTTTQIRSTTEHTPEFEDECRDNIEFIISSKLILRDCMYHIFQKFLLSYTFKKS